MFVFVARTRLQLRSCRWPSKLPQNKQRQKDSRSRRRKWSLSSEPALSSKLFSIHGQHHQDGCFSHPARCLNGEVSGCSRSAERGKNQRLLNPEGELRRLIVAEGRELVDSQVLMSTRLRSAIWLAGGVLKY